MKEENKLNMRRWIIIGVEVVIIIGLAFLLINMFQSSFGKLRAAQTSVKNLFSDDQFQEISLEITQADIDQANQLVNQISGANADLLEENIQTAQTKYNAIAPLKTIYGVEHPEELFNSEKELFINHQVDSTQVEMARAEFMENGVYNEFDQQVLDLYNHAYTVSQDIEQIRVQMEGLPVKFDTHAEVEAGINSLISIEDGLNSLEDYVVIDHAKEQLTSYCDQLSEGIVLNYETNGDYQPHVLDKISESPLLSKSLVGTPFGHLAKLVSLTFDDGPNPEFTPQVLDILDHYGIQGTFFVMGAYVDDHPELAKEIVDRGHIIANHTYNHFDMATLSDEEALKQITWTQDSIRDATGVTPDLFRFPFGSGGPHLLSLFPELESILWTVDTMDWYTHDAQNIHEVTMALLQPQAIILMHDTHQATPDALKTIIPVLIEQGYTFVAPDETGIYMPYYMENSHL